MPAKKKTTTKKTTTKKTVKPGNTSDSPKVRTSLKKLGALDAAAQVLKTAEEPMTCTAITDAMLKKNVWTANGKTPHATLYSAIIREITKKGREARFIKVDRGRFTLAGRRTT